MVQFPQCASAVTGVTLSVVAFLTLGAAPESDASLPLGSFHATLRGLEEPHTTGGTGLGGVQLPVKPAAAVFLRCPGDLEPDLVATVTVWVLAVAARVLPVEREHSTRGAWCDSAPSLLPRGAGAVLT